MKSIEEVYSEIKRLEREVEKLKKFKEIAKYKISKLPYVQDIDKTKSKIEILQWVLDAKNTQNQRREEN